MESVKMLFKIFNKYIEILEWLEKEKYVPIDSFRSSARIKEDLLKGIIHFQSPVLNFSRGDDFIEMGAPNREDLEVYEVTSNLDFTITGSMETMKRFVQFLTSFEKKKNNCFKDCHIKDYYSHDNYLPKLAIEAHELQWSWEHELEDKNYKAPIPEYYINFTVVFMVDKFDLAFNLSKEKCNKQKKF